MSARRSAAVGLLHDRHGMTKLPRNWLSVLMVEQNATMALSIADRGYVLSTGQIVLEGPASELLKSEDLKRAYLGR